MTEIYLLTAGIVLFLAGIYTGIWIQRHSYTEREVAKLIPTDKVVEIEKPVIVQVPVAQRPSNGGGSLAVMGTGNKNDILTPGQRQESEKMTDLLSQLPEA